PVARGIEEPARADLRRERAGEPGVEDVLLADEAARAPALRLVEAGRRVGGRIDGERVRVGDDRTRVVRAPARVERIPDRDRHAEVALAAHAPVDVQVLGPVAVAEPHEVGVPADLVALREERLLLLEEADEPLPRRDELERAVALLVELDRVLDRHRLAAERGLGAGGRARRLTQQLGDAPARLGDRLPRELGVEAVRGLGVEALPALGPEADGNEPAVAADDLAEPELLVAPPRD